MKLNFNWRELTLIINRGTIKDREAYTEQVYPKWVLLIYLVIVILSIGAWWFYFSNNLTLSYNDARSHLNVARRVVDNLQPGIVQIGSVWLPLFHILELPTIWNDFMFRTGLSGSIVSMISFIGSSIFIMKLARLFNLDYKAALVTLAVFSLNQNMLFMQALPMTESLMILTSLGAIYFFAKWVKYYHLTALILSGIFTFFAVITRYDGWFLFGFISFGVVLVSLFHLGSKKAEANFVIYSIIGLFGIILWIGWNGIIFGDPLFFINGQFSAKAQQDILVREGRLLTKNDLTFSTYTYLLAIKENIGLILTFLGGLGIIKGLFSRSHFTSKIAFSILLVPILFNIAGLYFGHSAIHLPYLPPYTWFNDRYGLMALPAFAVGIGFLVNKRLAAAIIVSVIIFLQSYILFASNNIITIQDGVRGASGYFLDDIGKWINKNAADGKILVAASSHDAMIFISGLPLKNFITEGTGIYWKESLVDPTKYADFIIMHEGDLVYKELNGTPIFLDNYKLVYRGQFSNVYKKVTQAAIQ